MPQKNYEVVARVADRGISEVFVARMAEDGGTRPVLMERLARARVADSDVVRSFLERARVGFQLAHPNIAQVLDVGRVGSTYYLTVEQLDGEILRAVIDHARAREKLQVPVRAAITIAAGVASALRHAHARQDGDGREVVHGNLSPANIAINRDGVVKVLDFGLAPEGELPYQSPEQVRGDAVDRRSDLFSLGALLWELLTREPAFKRGSSADTLAAIEDETVAAPSGKRMDIPHELDAIVGKLLAKAPGDRYQDADDLLVDLEALATKLMFQISTTDLSRMLRLWFGNKPNPAVLATHVEIQPEDLASDGTTEETEVDRQLDGVPPPPEAGRRSDTTTPPPATVEPPVESKESFEQIRDRILGARASNETSGPRSKAYTNPAIPLDGPRTTTLPFGMSPTAITDVITRVTQAASAQGAATRNAVARKTDLLPTDVKKTDVVATDAVEMVNIPKQTLPMGSKPTESSVVRQLEDVERRLVESAMAMPEAMDSKATESMDSKATEPADRTRTERREVNPANGKPTERAEARPTIRPDGDEPPTTQPVRTNQIEVVEPISEAKPMKTAAVKLDDELPVPRPEPEDHKEQAISIVLPRTQSTEWFERGEAEAKEAHARHAREIAEAREAPRRPRTSSMMQAAHEEEQHEQANRRSLATLGALALVAAALVVVAIVKFTGRERPSKALPTVASAGSAQDLAGSADTGSAGSDTLAGSAAVAGTAMLAGSDTGSAGSAMLAGSAGSDAASAGSAMLAGAAGSAMLAGSAGSATQVGAVIPPPPVDAAVIAPPVDAAQIAAVPVDAAKVAVVDAATRVPVDAARLAVVDAATSVPLDAAKVAIEAPKHDRKKPDHTEHKDDPKPQPPASIDDLYGKGDYAKADKACATNTQFNASILEMCFMSACQVKDSALANRWIHAIARSQREPLVGKCKDAGLEIAVP